MAGFIYIHVPKCGGSSFGAALRLRFLTSQATIRLGQGDPTLTGEAHILSDYAARRRELHAHVTRGVRMISGHVQYDPELHLTTAQNYGFLTLLRDPVDRFVSHYNYLQRKHPDDGRSNTLDAFIETPGARRLGSQYLFYFAGENQRPTQNTGALVSKAIRALSRFDLVGDLSEPHTCRAALRDIIGGPLPLWHRNRAPQRALVSRGLRRKLEEVCTPDLEIFESVRHHKAAA